RVSPCLLLLAAARLSGCGPPLTRHACALAARTGDSPRPPPRRRRGRLRDRGLTPHPHEALYGREGGEHEHHPQHRDEEAVEQQQEAGAQGTVGDGEGGTDRHHDAEQRQMVGGDATAPEVGADRAELLLHARPEALVEHEWYILQSYGGVRTPANATSRASQP